MLNKFKEIARAWLKSLTKPIYDVGLTPNALTIIGLLLSILSATIYLLHKQGSMYVLLATLIFLLAGVCDVLDGLIAETYGKKTVLGGFLDSVFDRYSDGIIIASFIIAGLCDVNWGLAALIGSFLVSYTRARAESLDVNMSSVGVAERAERVIIIVVFSLLSYVFDGALNYGIMLLAVLTNFTAIQRILYFYKKSNNPKKRPKTRIV